MKKCNKCLKSKELDLFYNNHSICKSCHKEEVYNYRKTKDGVSTSIYSAQCHNSIKRGHNKPEYSKEEFKNWLLNHKKFDKLYNDWVNSGYKKNLKPSPDRKNNDLGYSFKNLRLVTCIENIRGKRIEFKPKDYTLIHIPKFRIEGYPDFYFCTNNKLHNTRTNRILKKRVKCCSIGYELSGKFVTLKNLRKMLIKIDRISKNGFKQ